MKPHRKSTGSGVTKQHHDPFTFAAKAALRVAVLPDGPVRVLDCYAGDHDLWETVREVRPDVSVVHIDKTTTHPTDIKADNLKVLPGLNLASFDVIDLDAWGVPADQLAMIRAKGYTGVVTWTAILTGYRVPPAPILAAVGIDPLWKRDARMLLSGYNRLRELWCAFLADCGYSTALVMQPSMDHLYGAVGMNGDAFDRNRYTDAYHAVQRTGRYARIAHG